MVIDGKDLEGAAIASLGSSSFMVTEVFLSDNRPFVSKSSQHLKSEPAKGKWKNTHSKITRTNSIKCLELEGKIAFYDTFYVKKCFNNVKTNTSTWKLLLGKEHLAIGECTKPVYSEALKIGEKCGTQNNTILSGQTLIDENFEGKQCDELSVEIRVVVGSKVSNNERCIPTTSKVNHAHTENKVVDVSRLNTKSEPIISKEKYKVKKRRPEKFNDKTREMPKEYPATIEKYWQQRYTLFSRFDEGIKMDEEGWFSVTPEAIAQYQAKRCACGTIVDCFTGVGGNAIQFAKRSRNVIAVDIDSLKINYARHNATIYGVKNHIKFIVGDFFLLAPTLKADTVFLSPPWGGPDYNKVKIYDMKTMLRPHDGLTLFNAAKKIAPRVVMFLPKNVDFNQLAELALSSRPPWSLEVEKVYLNGRLKAITAYFTDPLRLRRQQS